MSAKKFIAALVACVLLVLCTQQSQARRHRIATNWPTKSCSTCSNGSCANGVCKRAVQAVAKKHEERKARRAHADKWLLRKVFCTDSLTGPQPVLLVFGSKATCKNCIAMDRSLADHEVQDQLREEGVKAVICDDSEAPAAVFDEFNATNLPKVVLGSMEASGEVTIYREATGRMTPHELLAFAKLPQELPPVADGG